MDQTKRKEDVDEGLQGTGLSDGVIRKIRSVFGQYPQIDSVFLYGSRAKGNHRPGSDIDLTIKLKPGLEPDLKLHHRIATQLDDLDLIYTIDLSFYPQIENPDLIGHIDRVGIRFY